MTCLHDGSVSTNSCSC